MTPRIYVADLAAYSAGRLRGVWIDLFDGITAEDLDFAIKGMLSTSPFPHAEEWDIHDSENMAQFKSHNLEKLCQIANLIHQHGGGAVQGYLSHRGIDDADPDEFSDYYLGCYTSEAAFCEEELAIAEAAAHIQVFDWATLDQYIDWDRLASDAFMNCYYSHTEAAHAVHVYVRQ